MANQPVRKKTDYGKNFSNELQEVFKYATEELSNTFPFTVVDFDIFHLFLFLNVSVVLSSSLYFLVSIFVVLELRFDLLYSLWYYNAHSKFVHHFRGRLQLGFHMNLLVLQMLLFLLRLRLSVFLYL